ncbi:hypothetical protein CK203_055533 [Vitis vinifera]|uniref:Integrase catalytic domain-containing protein n=1 Tax=Vitis vinifera TaxID=29760 RepID=A0A438GXL6_VITVI|nr:hypothetical protein CK203_055533 [Vitis vinifera]
MLVATNYFSKWVEAEAYASIKDKDVTKFVWKNIICRFGIPQAIIADNGLQFNSIAFRNFCSELKIQNLYSTPRYPKKWASRSNNKTLLTAIKKRLERAKGSGWRNCPRFMGLPDQAWATHGKHSIRLCMQHGCSHPTEIGTTLSLKIGTLVLRKVFETPPKEEPGSSKKIGKTLISSLKQVKAGLITSKS